MKLCTKCQVWKPYEEFYIKDKYYRHCYCKECCRLISRQSREINREIGKTEERERSEFLLLLHHEFMKNKLQSFNTLRMSDLRIGNQ